ncbi:hypothetical protein RV11_GL003507 [Enterococcus phoeniculicola]|uniref:hypothetical protein n=1 Tax=Enterococcus phoeniculicola TaxID=154621 RepID=UPI00091FBBAE|nr:hypothetical protein [Enterococcus phoeniculicola]OJG71786.1 hypothetical protein RV11_GL003507 [Enterococcus phoeniculicola]
MDLVKTILEHYPNWSINDVLDTDITYLYEIMFIKTPKKKKKVVRPLSDLVKGGG